VEITPGESLNAAIGTYCANWHYFDKGFTPFHSYACAAMMGAFATVPSAVNMISPTRHYDRCA
jgi:hypothetical protein